MRNLNWRIDNTIKAIKSNGSKKIDYDIVNEELFKKWHATHNDRYRQQIIVINARLCSYEASKFSNTGYETDELSAEGVIGLVKAVNTFDSAREIKFATYATRCIDNEILMYLRRNKKNKSNISLDEVISRDNEGHELSLANIIGTDAEGVINDAINSVLDETTIAEIEVAMDICHLSVAEKRVLDLRYGLSNGTPLNQKEVAVAIGISQSYISRLERKAKIKIRDSKKHHLKDYYHE